MAKKDAAFVENDDTVAAEPRRNARLTLPLTDDGRIDWDRARTRQKEAFVEAVRNDPATLDAMELQQRPAAVPGELQITEEHVKAFLSIYVAGERVILPWAIKQKTKGKVIIPAQLAARVYDLSDAQKDALAPPGAQWANENLPVWLKEWIARIGPGAQFFGGLAVITMAQTQQVMAEWAKMQEQSKPASVPPNGHAVEEVPPS